METILVQVNSEKAYELLKNLEDLHLIKLLKKGTEKNKKPSDYCGTLTKEGGERFHSYVSESREEWNRNI